MTLDEEEIQDERHYTEDEEDDSGPKTSYYYYNAENTDGTSKAPVWSIIRTEFVVLFPREVATILAIPSTLSAENKNNDRDWLFNNSMSTTDRERQLKEKIVTQNDLSSDLEQIIHPNLPKDFVPCLQDSL